ncbi:MAG: type 2 lanthipeptide synthetase LanM family protein [Mycobacteriales bacterium]
MNPPPPSAPEPALMSATWWAPGLALHERPAGAAPAAVRDTSQARLAAWCSAYQLAATGQFAVRLADAGLDEAGLLGLLAEPPAELAGRVTRPDWADTVERVLRLAGDGPARLPEPTGDATELWQRMFAAALHPFVADARDRLVREGELLAGAGDARAQVDLPAIADAFAAQLGRRMARLAARTLVLELNLASGAGLLAGRDGRERFADFVRRTGTAGGLARLFATYPVLARLLAETSGYAVDAHLELLARYLADRTEIVAVMFAGADPGPVVAVAPGQGDTHHRGRSVAILSFAGGRRLVYKPRGLAAQVRLGELVAWLNAAVPGLDLRTVTVLARPGYGWAEFVDHRPLADRAAAERFYRRTGALLALLHLVHASDVHCENVIACADQPVLVDAETLFHPTLAPSAAGPDPAARTLTGSVKRTGLLPQLVVGEHGAQDLSGLGGDTGSASPEDQVGWESPATDRMRLIRVPGTFAGAGNRPVLDGQVLDPTSYEGALREGFRLGYDAVARRTAEFAALVEAFAGTEVRIVVRPTRLYARLLDESTHPDLLRDALDRDQAFDLLWAAGSHPLPTQRLVRHEIADLWAGDVPCFTARPDACDVWTFDGQRVADAYGDSGLARSREKLAALGQADRADQEWIISATLATRRPAGGHSSGDPVVPPLPGSAAEPGRLLAAACAIGDQLVARGLTGPDRVNWLGLELVDEGQWLVLPLGAGLANGYLGVALFLAQLADLTGVPRYAEVALRAVRPVPWTCESIAGHAELVAAVGCGAYDGFGGIAYALARLATLLADEDTRQWTALAVRLAEKAAAGPAAAHVAAGTAGCLAAMTAVHQESGLPAAAELARSCGDRLAALAERTGGGCDLPAGGFTRGSAGVGWALARYAAAGGGDRCARAASTVLDHARIGLTPGSGDSWCAGTAGLAAAQAGLAGASVEWAVKRLAGRPVLRDLSLCHGELGIAEALVELAARRPDSSAARARRRRGGLVLDAIGRYGASCGTPGGVPTPGLLSGLAGIGYGLLRLAFPERVPSVLLLEPTPPGAGVGGRPPARSPI